MKRIKVPTSYTVVIIIGFFLVLVMAARYRAKYTKELIARGFAGKISKYELGSKGTMYIWLNKNKENYSFSGFSKYADTITIGDSLFKDAHSRSIYYYKLKDGNYYLYDIFKID